MYSVIKYQDLEFMIKTLISAQTLHIKVLKMVEMTGIEPVAFCMLNKRSSVGATSPG